MNNYESFRRGYETSHLTIVCRMTQTFSFWFAWDVREMPHSGCRCELAVMVMKCWWRPQKSFCWESCQFEVGWWLNGNNTALSQRHLKQGRRAYVDICIHTASPPPTNNHRYHSTWQWRGSPAKIWTFTLSPFFLNLPKNKPWQEKNSEKLLHFIFYSRTAVSVHSRVITMLEFQTQHRYPGI